MAEKQILALSGKSRGVLRLEYGGQLGFSVESPAYLRDAELWLLFSDEEWSIMPNCQGECPLPQRRVQAAAVARDGAFVMTGGRADFAAAKSACFTRQEKARLKALEVQAVARASIQREKRENQEQQARAAAQGREQEQVRVAAGEPGQATTKEWAQTKATWTGKQEQPEAASMRDRRGRPEAALEQKEQKQAEAREPGRGEAIWKKASMPRPAEPMRAQGEWEEEGDFSLPVPEVVSAAALSELRRAAEPERPAEKKEKAREQMEGRLEECSAATPVEPPVAVREEEAPQSQRDVEPPSARRGLFPALEKMGEEEPQKIRPQRAADAAPKKKAPRTRCFERKESEVSPFPKIFPSSHWMKIEYPAYPGRGHYLVGEIYQGQNCAAKALAVPGRYALNPPAWLKGFETYLEDGEGQGYWLLFQDDAGKPLPIAQVFRDLREEC